MITLETRVRVRGVRGIDLTEFFLNPTDEAYRRWWPGTHIAFHVVKGTPGHVGDLVWMDELIGRHRLRMKAVVEDVVAARRIVWRAVKVVKLPVRITMELEDSPDGVEVTHTIRAGGEGAWRFLDPLLRLPLSEEFARDMDEHARTEFPRLAEMLKPPHA